MTQDKDGVYEKPAFNGGYQCDEWFNADPITPEKTRWEALAPNLSMPMKPNPNSSPSPSPNPNPNLMGGLCGFRGSM